MFASSIFSGKTAVSGFDPFDTSFVFTGYREKHTVSNGNGGS